MLATERNAGFSILHPESLRLARETRDALIVGEYLASHRTLADATRIGRDHGVHWRTVYRAVEQHEKTRPGATEAGDPSTPDGASGDPEGTSPTR